jgi:hypothetical protein
MSTFQLETFISGNEEVPLVFSKEPENIEEDWSNPVAALKRIRTRLHLDSPPLPKRDGNAAEIGKLFGSLKGTLDLSDVRDEGDRML